ncbi:alpha/beta fold hydrolase [Sciscionella marina]|uniref:alpha/beta fold hydrolase n=1 Tax=Sciscionella marina TaxID=508770 RepID=UPI0003612CCA|nr:alpha/beta hydrolase [Sciscionella marina]
MPRIELSAGPIDYLDTGGEGPVLVLTHGLPMNETQWRKVVPLLHGYRCVLPTLPLGGHRTPMHADADLTQQGLARLLAEFLERLDLRDVTVVMNDWGGPQFLVAEGCTERVARLVFVACEAFDNFPPGSAKGLARLLRIPGGTKLAVWLFGRKWFRQSRQAYGALSLRGVPDEVMRDWFEPLTSDANVLRDFVKFATSAPKRARLLELSERLREFDRPVLVVWADRDKLMPRAHGRRLAALFPDSRLVEIASSGTLIPEDQPERLTEVLTGFLAETGAVPADGVTGR